MPDWVVGLPLLFPLAGALLFIQLAGRVSSPARTRLGIAFLALELGMLGLNVAPGSHQLVISIWPAASFSLAFQMDGVTQLLLLTMLIPIAVFWLIDPPRMPFDLTTLFVWTAAMALSAAGNLTTAFAAWMVLDLSLFVWRLVHEAERDNALRALIVGQIGGLVLFAGLILLGANSTGLGRLLVALAFWARLSLFPFHTLLPLRGTDPEWLWVPRGIPLIAGSSLWLHTTILGIEAPVTPIGILTALSIAATLIWVWQEEHPTGAAAIATSQAIALVPITIALGGSAGTAMGLWLTLSCALAVALFEMGMRWRAENLNRYPRLIWLLGIVALAGLPLTPAFIGKIGLYVAMWQSGNWAMLLFTGAGMLIVLVPIWRFAFAQIGSEQREPTRTEYAGLLLVALAWIALALLPIPIAHALSPAVGDSAERAIDLVLRTNDVLALIIGILIALAPLVGSFILRGGGETPPEPSSFIQLLGHILDLGWLERLLKAIGLRLSSTARTLATIVEENPTVWLLFVALWVAIFIMIER